MRTRLLLAFLLWPGLAAPYVTTDGDRTRWAAAPQPGVADLSMDMPAVECRAALAASFAQWGAVDALLPMPAPIDGPADITIGFVRDRPDLVGVVGVTLTTTEGQDEGRRIVRAEVILNDDFNWSVDGPRGTLRVQATATHEIGHALGLGHSADRAATMYWHYDAGGAALAEDDRRGLRFLYGDVTGQGRACDQCAVAADCAGGVCLQRFNEGDRPFCTRPCGDGCAIDEVCVGLRGGGDACAPAHGFCGDGGGLPTGAACWGPFQCTGADRCVVYPGDARCSAPCQGPLDCDGASVCALDPVDLPRVCLPAGPAEPGEACAWATDCASGVCLPSGVCSAWCDDGCPIGWRCAAHPHWPDAPRVCARSAPDAGVMDAAVLDAAVLDAAVIDMAVIDMRRRDAAAMDADVIPDAGSDDAAVDGQPTDASPADGSRVDPQPSGSARGDCAQTGRGSGAGWLLLMVLCARRRARRFR